MIAQTIEAVNALAKTIVYAVLTAAIVIAALIFAAHELHLNLSWLHWPGTQTHTSAKEPDMSQIQGLFVSGPGFTAGQSNFSKDKDNQPLDCKSQANADHCIVFQVKRTKGLVNAPGLCGVTATDTAAGSVVYGLNLVANPPNLTFDRINRSLKVVLPVPTPDGINVDTQNSKIHRDYGWLCGQSVPQDLIPDQELNNHAHGLLCEKAAEDGSQIPDREDDARIDVDTTVGTTIRGMGWNFDPRSDIVFTSTSMPSVQSPVTLGANTQCGDWQKEVKRYKK